MRNRPWLAAATRIGALAPCLVVIGLACARHPNAVVARQPRPLIVLKPQVTTSERLAAELYPEPLACIVGSPRLAATNEGPSRDSKAPVGVSYGIVERQPGARTPPLEPGKI